MSFSLYNTLSRRIEDFEPINPPCVSLYTCGQTVYDFTHLGSLRKYTNDDLLKRALTFMGYTVKHVQNVTDVGHLTSDSDTGQDKLEKGAVREGKSVWEVAKFYEKHFFESINQLNIQLPDVSCRATEHIEAQIKLIEKLEQKGYTYQTDEAVYFDVSKFEGYGALSGQILADKIAGAREEVVVDPKKKNAADFVLWFKRVGSFKEHVMHWEAPWGDGFPGWHIECSAMAMQYLGEQIDIHTGGVDHIPVHHENEIAQAEAATGKHFVNFWVHHEFLVVEGAKMSKSLQNFYTLEDVKKKGFSPLDLRYLFLTAHYRQKLNFTWQALEGARSARESLVMKTGRLKATGDNRSYPEVFRRAISDDLNIPKALAVVWKALKADVSQQSLFEMDKVLGLGLEEAVKTNGGKVRQIPESILLLAKNRDQLRAHKEYSKADDLRQQLEKEGYTVEDTKDGTKIY
ncbi:MAG: cysteine--tRNA ligase [Patescibacteria group bacterium]